MRIITVNLPVTYLKAIDGLIGEHALYPSRSELIRCACRDFLIRELEAAKTFTPFTSAQMVPIQTQPDLDQKLFVQVPIGSNTNGIPEMKTFRLVKK
jgi:metal-responsive CopG/Arc/MetJ family transcriptional regulator